MHVISNETYINYQEATNSSFILHVWCVDPEARIALLWFIMQSDMTRLDPLMLG